MVFNIGICFGGYCPMHRGHLDVIMKAKKQNDKDKSDYYWDLIRNFKKLLGGE